MITYEQKRNIGFQYVMERLAPCSSYGAALLRDMRPFARGREEALREELDGIERTIRCAAEHPGDYAGLAHLFMQMKDIRASLRRCGEAVLGEVELFEIKRQLLQMSEIVPLFEQLNRSAGYPGISFRDTRAALDILDPDGYRTPSFHIGESYSERLADIRRQKRELERELRLRPGRPELVEQRREAAAMEAEEEERVRALLSERLRPYAADMLANTDTVARLDLLMQKASLAVKYGAAKPEVGGERLVLTEMSSPEIADALRGKGGEFTPVTLELEAGATVITGANMGGKSVALKAVALNVLMVHYGFYAFARSAAVPLFDEVYLVSEDLEASERGLSSFGGEVVALNEIVRAVKRGFCLVLLDEFARGTNPEEGAAIARGVAEYLNASHAVSVLATHYDGVACRARAHYQAAGLMNADMDSLRARLADASEQERVALIAGHMDYGLCRVAAGTRLPRDAVNICRLLGMDEKMLKMIEKDH